MQTKFSVFSNTIFKYFILFAISFLWLNFYIENFFVVTSISLIISLLVGKITSLINKRKKNAITLNLKEQEKMKEISLSFYLADDNKIINFFSLLLQTKREININNGSLSWQDCVFIPYYKQNIIGADYIAEIFKNNRKYNKIFIAGIAFSDEAKQLALNIKESKITLLDENQIYKILKKYDLYPDFKVKLNKKEKFKLKYLKNVAFNRHNTKRYLISGLIILFTSFFIRYNIYYLIFATLLFVFAGISYFKPNKKLPDLADEL